MKKVKDIQADKFISHLTSNSIDFEKEGEFVRFFVEHKKKKKEIYYQKSSEMFFIDKPYYNGQPHINEHIYIHSGLRIKYWLCLTMDISDRRSHNLNAIGKIKRIKQIVFEIWEDPIEERFKEINVSYQTIKHPYYFLKNDKSLWERNFSHQFPNVLFVKKDFALINIKFKGQTREKIINNFKVKESKSQLILLNIIYKKETKKMLLINGVFFKINDFTDESFWSRNGINKNQKNIKIVGLGSIGGLVLDFMCKNGYRNINIYDKDEMDVVNNPRHVLGINANQISIPKAIHLHSHYLGLFPMIKINPFLKNFLYPNEQVHDGDVIINTTGGPISKIFGKYLSIRNANANKQIVYIDIFIEPFALGVHAIVLNSKYEENNFKMKYGCQKNERYLVTKEKDFRRNFDGCFTPTLPYGFAPLQIGVPLLLLEIIKDKFVSNHYTIPFLSVVEHEQEVINKELSKKINANEVKVKVWEN